MRTLQTIFIFLFFIGTTMAQSSAKKKPMVYDYYLDSSKNNLFTTPVYVSKGDTLTIITTGKIKLGQFAGSTDADGLPNGRYANFNRVKGANHGALLCRFGNEKGWTAIGTGGKFVAHISGKLNFCINDREFLNNSGEYKVHIEVVSGWH